MKDVKFVLGECTRSNNKYYFQYNNKAYFIIEKSPTHETVIDRITNIRNAYEKWKSIKADSDEKDKKNSDNGNGEVKEKDYSYTTMAFEYESDISLVPKFSKDRIPKEKVKFEKIVLDNKNEEKFEKIDKSDRKRPQRKNDFDKKNKDDRFKEERFREERHKNFKKNNTRYEKGNSYNRRNEHKGDKQSHNA